MHLLHIGFVILIIAAVQNYYYLHANKSLLPDYLLRLKILPPRSFQLTGGASQHRLFFLQSTKGLTFIGVSILLFATALFSPLVI